MNVATRKHQPSRAGTVNAVCVKNTFIDDWIVSAGGEHTPEPIIFRSVPPRITECSMLQANEVTDVLPAKVILTDTSPDIGKLRSDCSTAASSCSLSDVGEPEVISVTPGLAAAPRLEILNTFVHFHGKSEDERIVQSMPHGMFSQCLADALSGNSYQRVDMCLSSESVHEPLQMETVTTIALNYDDVFPRTPENVRHFVHRAHIEGDRDLRGEPSGGLAAGTEVVIDGLKKLPAFNGKKGTIQSFDEDSGRYNVLLAASADGHKWAKVKADNLQRYISCPPCYSPTCSGNDRQINASPVDLPSTPMWVEGVSCPLRLTALM
jgi:hypothetical protein